MSLICDWPRYFNGVTVGMVKSHIIFLLKGILYRILNSIPTFQKQIHIENWCKIIKHIRPIDYIPRPMILVCLEALVTFFIPNIRHPYQILINWVHNHVEFSPGPQSYIYRVWPTDLLYLWLPKVGVQRKITHSQTLSREYQVVRNRYSR